MAEKGPQKAVSAAGPDSGVEAESRAGRTAVDARAPLDAPGSPEVDDSESWEDETVDERNRKTVRAVTAPTEAAANEGSRVRPPNGSSSEPSFVELGSGDLIEPSTDRSVPTVSATTGTGAEAADAPPASVPPPPEALAEQPTLIYREAPPGPKLVIIGGNDRGHEFALDRPQMTIGRGTDNEIILADIAVSRSHVVILMDGTRSTLRDLQSGNGTLVNGQRVSSCVLRDGDQIELGNTLLRFVHPVPEVAADATMPSESVGPHTATGAGDRPAVAAGVVGGRTPLVSVAPQRTRIADHARTAWSWVTSRVRQASPRNLAIAAALVVLAGGGLIWRCAATPRASVATAAGSGEVEQLFDSGVRSFRANKFQEARQTFAKLLTVAPEHPKVKVYVERCDIEIASGQALEEARAAMAARDYKRARAALDKVDAASLLFEEARALRTRMGDEAAGVAAAPAPPPPRVAPVKRPAPAASPGIRAQPFKGAAGQPKLASKPATAAPPPPGRMVAVRPRSHERPSAPELSSEDLLGPLGTGKTKEKEPPMPPPPPGGYDKAAVAHYFARDWGSAYNGFKSAADTQKGKSRERMLVMAEDVRKAGQAFLRGEQDRSNNPSAAIREYDEALAIDKRLPFSRGHHAPYLIAQLQKLSRAAALAAYAAGNFEQAQQAARNALQWAPGDPAVNKVLLDLEAKARDFVSRGLALKDSRPEQARLLFRRVLKFVPPTSLSYQKAYATLNAMPKPPADDDE